MAISKDELLWIKEKPKLEDDRSMLFKDATRSSRMLKELQERKYPFLDSDLLGMLNDLL